MRALQFTAYGGPEVLMWGDAPVPDPGPGQIRIAVRAASVNPVDWKVLAGAMSGGQPLAGPAAAADPGGEAGEIAADGRQRGLSRRAVPHGALQVAGDLVGLIEDQVGLGGEVVVHGLDRY